MKKRIAFCFLILLVAAMAGNAFCESFDELEVREYLQLQKPSPMDTPYVEVSLTEGSAGQAGAREAISLDGTWKLWCAEESDGYTALSGLTVTESSGQWSDAFRDSLLVDGIWRDDNSMSGGWVSTGSEATSFVTVDLGKQTDIARLMVYHNPDPTVITSDYRIEASADGSRWDTLISVTGNTQVITTHEVDATCRYIKLVVTKANPALDSTARIYELRVFTADDRSGPVSEETAIDAQVPGSVHLAMVENGLLDDPYYGLNDAEARKISYKPWNYKKEFTFTGDTAGQVLRFDGICESGNIYLNGQYLGSFKGMFTPVEFDVSDVLVQGTNTILVENNAAPYRLWNPAAGELTSFFMNMNVGWADTIVFNNNYGWHYANMPSIGIWQSVKLEKRPAVQLDSPFISTVNTDGLMDYYVELTGDAAGSLVITVTPENFAGSAQTVTYPVSGGGPVHLRFSINDPQLWWPNGLGDQPLYTLETSFYPADGSAADYHTSLLGIRTVETKLAESTPASLSQHYYEWAFIINGKEVFFKGANWCTIDAMMDFSYEKYDRLLTLGKKQGLQLLRAWGSGMVETDTFYELCNRYGIMVMQEWPTAWDSYRTQPEAELYQTVIYNTKRLRNNPALLFWCGGNEGVAAVTEPVLNNMGRLTIENDGTRPWHRQDAAGGSVHDYSCYWGDAHLDHNVATLGSGYAFISEFGIPSMPNHDSVYRYLPEDEQGVWPPPANGTLLYHLPVFNQKACYTNMERYASYFSDLESEDEWIISTQLAQSEGSRHTVERARASFPKMTGVCYYKLTDVYPAASWAVIDSYGAPKLAYYTLQDAYAPVQSVMSFSTVNGYGKRLSIPVYLLDDAGEIAGDWSVTVRAFDGMLNPIKEEHYTGSGTRQIRRLGKFELSEAESATCPLFFVLDTTFNGKSIRNYYYINYETVKGSLFRAPRTQLAYTIDQNTVTITNTGDKPAYSVHFAVTDSARFSADDNYLWLDSGESVTVAVENPGLITGVTAWNVGSEDDTAPSTPQGLTAEMDGQRVSLVWEAAGDAESGVLFYRIYRNGSLLAETQSLGYTDEAAAENTAYTYEVAAVNGAFSPLESERATAGLTTPADTIAPTVDVLPQQDGTLYLTYSEPVYHTAESYGASGGTCRVTIADSRHATIALDLPDLLGSYTFTIQGVHDYAAAQNPLAPFEKDVSPLAALYHLDGTDAGFAAENTAVEKGVEQDGLAMSSGRAQVNAPAGLESGFTFALFVKKAEAESDYYQILFARDEKASANHYELYLNPANELCFYGPFGDYHSGLVLDDTDWHFVSLRYDGAELVFAVDGEETSVTASSIALADGAAPLTLGELAEPTGGMPFAGMLDCLAVFRRSLTDNELQQLAVNLATTLSQNGSYVSAIAESGGTYQVETTYTAAEGGLYIAAAYENGRLLALSAADQTQATLTVPANGGHVTVKAFFLQGGAGIAPLAPAANK